jgi:hypothetical protein
MIGKTIISLLNVSGVTSIVGTRIFPYVMEVDTATPAVTFTIDSLIPEYDKAGWCHDDIVFGIHCFCKDYDTLQNLVAATRAALELKSTGSGSQDIGRIYLTGQKEGYNISEDKYYNRQTFKLKIKTY